MSAQSNNMRAWVYRSKGHPSKVLSLENDYPRPTPSGKFVLVQTKAVSLNPVGYKMMSLPPLCWFQKTPCVPESDVSGVIVEGDLAGTDLKVGDEVYGIKPAGQILRSGEGVLAEYCLVEKSLLRRKPNNVAFEEAAAVPLAAHTAFVSLVDQGGLKKGGSGKVFVNGGSGGVGAFAVQIAVAYGYQVSTTCSPSSRSLVQSLSSSIQIFDYTSSPLQEQLAQHVNEDKKPFDLIFDTIGTPSLYQNSPSYLSVSSMLYIDIAGPHIDGSFMNLVRAGAYLMSSLLRPSYLGGVPRKYKFVGMQPTRENTDEMTRMLADGSLKVKLDEVFSFEDAKKAYERSMSGRAKGKVVVRVSE